MSIALSREDIRARLVAMPPHSRGRRAMEAMLAEMTKAEMLEHENRRVEREISKAFRPFVRNTIRQIETGKL